MRQKRKLVAACLIGMSLLLCGCGETVYELTDSEEDIIVNYAAHIVAKYNKRQPEGYTFVYVEPEEEEPVEEPEDTTTEQQEETDPKTDTLEAEGAQAEESQEEKQVSLADVLGLPEGVQAIYTGVELTDSYDFILPEMDHELMVVHVALKNATETEVACDVLVQTPTFRMTVNEEHSVTADIALTMDNLSTYQGTIPAGETVDTVMLYQVEKGLFTSDAIASLQLAVMQNGQTAVFPLL